MGINRIFSRYLTPPIQCCASQTAWQGHRNSACACICVGIYSRGLRIGAYVSRVGVSRVGAHLCCERIQEGCAYRGVFVKLGLLHRDAIVHLPLALHLGHKPVRNGRARKKNLYLDRSHHLEGVHLGHLSDTNMQGLVGT